MQSIIFKLLDSLSQNRYTGFLQYTDSCYSLGVNHLILKQHEDRMRLAIDQALIAGSYGDVPVGCVIFKGEDLISVGYNNREKCQSSLGHAELTAIDEASKKLGSWRLSGCTLYVTLEPCAMCMGAIISSRIDSVVFGARDQKSGCCGSLIQLADMGFNHRPRITADVLSDECSSILSGFFKLLRE